MVLPSGSLLGTTDPKMPRVYCIVKLFSMRVSNHSAGKGQSFQQMVLERLNIKMQKNEVGGLNVVVRICNPCYSGGEDQEDPWFKASPGKKLIRPHLKQQAQCGVICL
jgi:hypothetical protein